MSYMTKKGTQKHMGDVSNLITDMTIMGASDSELARAVRHSMVVIDAEKHKLNYKQSAKDNQISQLKTKYQGGPTKGAATIISRASGAAWVPQKMNRVDIDPATGKKIQKESGKHWVDKDGNINYNKVKSTPMAETDDARTLMGTNRPIEQVYASHANTMKALANQARKEMVSTPPLKYDPQAAKTYPAEITKLKADLRIAEANAPRERRAQLVAGVIVDAKLKANPDMDAEDVKKIRNQALREAREKTGASKDLIPISDKQWEAIQAGAISNNLLTKILDHTDLERVQALATPRTKPTMSATAKARAKAMYNSGATQAEIAAALGVSTSTVSDALD